MSGGRKGVVGFGGRNDGTIVLKEVRDVLNRIRWDLAEALGVEFGTVKVYVEDDMDVDQQRLCRQWVREGKCERGRGCKYSHKHSLVSAGIRLRPSSKSSGSIGPWRLLEGYGLEATMAASSPSVMSGGQQQLLHRTLFIEFNGEVCWDKEDAVVWEKYIARAERGSFTARSSLAASDSVADESDLEISKSNGSLEPEGNGYLHALPLDICLEIFSFLTPDGCARCRQTCLSWCERVSEPETWVYFLNKTFNLSLPSTYGDARQDYERLACVCRNAQVFVGDRFSALSGGGGGGGAMAGGHSGEDVLCSPAPISLRRFAGHGKMVMAIHVDETRDRLISAAVSGEIRVWELHTGQRLGMADLRAPLSCMAVSERSIHCGTTRGTIHVIDRDDLTSIQTIKLSGSSVCSLCLLPAPTGLRAMFAPRSPSSSPSTSEYMVAGLGNGSFVIIHGTTPLHSYALPVTHPACVFVAPTGPESFIAASSPDKLFVWSGPLPHIGDGTSTTTTSAEAALASPPLKILSSSSMREGDKETRHREGEACDVVVIILSEGLMGRQVAVTACNHDLCLRWWELGGGTWGRGGSCTHLTEAFSLDERAQPPSGGGGTVEINVGTLALAHAKGVLLSAHMDGSLVVWHVGKRTRVARYSSRPSIEAMTITPSSLGIFSSFERHVIYSSEVLRAVEDEETTDGKEGVRKGGKSPLTVVKQRRRKVVKGGNQSPHTHVIHH